MSKYIRRQMRYANVPLAVILDLNLSLTARVVYGFVAGSAGRRPITEVEISEALGISQKAAIDALRELAARYKLGIKDDVGKAIAASIDQSKCYESDANAGARAIAGCADPPDRDPLQ